MTRLQPVLPLLALLLLCAGPGPRAQAAQLLYSNGFDGSLGDIWKMMGCHGDTYTLVTSPKRSGSHAVKHTMRGHHGCSEFDGSYKHRAQLMHGREAGLIWTAAERGPLWFGFSMLVPADFPRELTILFDMQSNNGHTGEFVAYLSGGNRLDIRPKGGTAPGPVPIALEPGAWTDFVIYLERSKSNGVLKVWVGGQLRIDYQGPTLAAGLPGESKSFFRTGLYWGAENRGGHYTLYYDNVKIASGGGDGYSLVAPSGSGSNVVQGNNTGGGAASEEGTIGYSSVGNLQDPVGRNYINAFRSRASSDMTVSQMRTYIARAAGGRLRLAIYSDNNGSPGSLLRATQERSGLGTGWQTFNLSAPLSLTEGSYYWLAEWTDDDDYLFAAKSESQVCTYVYTTYGSTWPSSFPGNRSPAPVRHSLYAQ